MWATHFIKTKHSRKLKLDIKLKRVPIEIVVAGFESTLIKGHLLLNDITAKGIAIYTATRLTEGQEISIKVKEPKEFTCKGVVAFCVENLSDSHIVSENVFTQRTGVLHKFENEEEKKKFLTLLGELHVKYMGIVLDEAVVSAPAVAVAVAVAPVAPVAPDAAPAAPATAEGTDLLEAA